MENIMVQIEKTGVIPVVVINDVEDAEPLAQALCEGGLPCAEVTFRTAAAEESIRKMTDIYPNMLIGAGTVLTTEQVDRAVVAGAKFIVSPGFDPEVVDYCILKQIPVFPGCITPSEVAQAVKRGLKVVKFFPGSTVWRRFYDSGTCSTLCWTKVYAYRRCKRKKFSGLSAV